MTIENCGPIAGGAPGVDQSISFVDPRDFVVEGHYAYHRQS
jgi:hypothetical protein